MSGAAVMAAANAHVIDAPEVAGICSQPTETFCESRQPRAGHTAWSKAATPSVSSVSAAPRCGIPGAYDRGTCGLRRGALLAILAVGAITVAACGGDDAESGTVDAARPTNGFPEWPAPDDPIERTTEAGLTPEVREQLQTHRHSHLDVFVDGEAAPVPAGIGIDITDPGVRHFPDGSYGASRSAPIRASHRCTPTTRPASSTPRRPATRC